MGPCLLGVLLLATFKSPTVAGILLALLSVAGLYHALRRPRQLFARPTTRLFLFLFLCLWVPQLLSLPDAIHRESALRVSGSYLRWLLAGLFLLYYAPHLRGHLTLGKVVFFVVGIWLVDLCIQYLFGYNPLHGGYSGNVEDPDILYPHHALTIPLVTFSPLWLTCFWQHRRYWLLVSVAWAMAVLAFLLKEERAAWLMILLCCLGLFPFLLIIAENRRRAFCHLAIAILIAGATTFAASLDSAVKEHLAQTSQLFKADFESVNTATSERMALWKEALRLWRENPMNGIGVRGFRHAFEDFGIPNFSHSETTHPHLHILEIASETGILGLLGYLLCLGLLGYHFLRLAPPARRTCWPFLLCVLIALFPLNLHGALYSSRLSLILWTSILLLCFVLPSPAARGQPSSQS